uniref:Uncharacterized protein n=1 Tax=Magallana gigas TaxID=29159 RepID=K1PY68_MAGGI
MFRRNYRENLVKRRLHTTSNVTVQPLQNGRIKVNELFMQNPSILEHINSKVTDEEKKLVADSRRKSIEESGLWQLASAQMFNLKAQRTHNFEDHAMAIFARKVAINKMRQRIEKKLDLPTDHFSRIATLRSNVQHIERRFRNIVQGSSSDNAGSTHIHALQRFDVEDDQNRDPKFMKPGEALQFFRRYARIVLIILKWIELIMDSSEGNKLERELKSFVDIANEVSCENVSRSMDEYGLSFDKNYFVAKKEVMHGLQALRSLSEYPLGTQEKLCQVAWYQTLGPKKAIVRQGHDAESFYFILAGTAFVKKMMTDPKTGETRLNTVARLTRGMSFGGSCEVLKKLRNVKARKSCQIKRKPDPITEIVLPELGGGPECKVDTGQRRRKHKIYMNTDVFQDMANYYEALRRKLAKEEFNKNNEDDVHLPPLPSNPHSNLVSVPEAEVEKENELQNDKNKDIVVMNGPTEEKIICIPKVGCRDPFSSVSESKFMTGPNSRYHAHFVRMFGTVSRPLPSSCPVCNTVYLM